MVRFRFWLVEIRGVEPLTSYMRSKRSTNWAISPCNVGYYSMSRAKLQQIFVIWKIFFAIGICLGWRSKTAAIIRDVNSAKSLSCDPAYVIMRLYRGSSAAKLFDKQIRSAVTIKIVRLFGTVGRTNVRRAEQWEITEGWLSGQIGRASCRERV